jgi:alpha-tubulin suppressor-like RCC1 family protein
VKPHQVVLPVESLETRIAQICCGRSHILVLTDKEGGCILHMNDRIVCHNYFSSIFSLILVQLIFFKCSNVTVFSMGGNSQGQCGIGDNNVHQVNRFQKLHIPEKETIVKVCK